MFHRLPSDYELCRDLMKMKSVIMRPGSIFFKYILIVSYKTCFFEYSLLK